MLTGPLLQTSTFPHSAGIPSLQRWKKIDLYFWIFTPLTPTWHLHWIFTLVAPKQALQWRLTPWHNRITTTWLDTHWEGYNRAPGTTTSPSTAPWMRVPDSWQEPMVTCLHRVIIQGRHISRPQSLFFDWGAALTTLNMPGQPAEEGLWASQPPSSPHPRRGRGRGARRAGWCAAPPRSASQTPRRWRAAAGFPGGGPAAGCAGRSRRRRGSSSRPPRGARGRVGAPPVGKRQKGELWLGHSGITKHLLLVWHSGP